MIVGALAGVLSVSDYRVDVDAVASIHSPESILQDSKAWIADGRRSSKRHHTARLAAADGPAQVANCAPQSVASPEPIQTGVCVAPAVDDEQNSPIVAADGGSGALDVPCDPAGPQLPVGVLLAREPAEDVRPNRLEHWPTAAGDDVLAALPVGPEIPEAIVVARASERLQRESEARERAQLEARVRAAEQEWFEEHARMIEEAAHATALAKSAREAVAAIAAARAARQEAEATAAREQAAQAAAEALAAAERERTTEIEQVVAVVTEIEPPPVTADADQPALLILAGLEDGTLTVQPDLVPDADAPVGPEIDSELLLARRQAAEDLAELERNRPVGPEIDEIVLAKRREETRIRTAALARAALAERERIEAAELAEKQSRDALARLEQETLDAIAEAEIAEKLAYARRAEEAAAIAAEREFDADAMGPPLPTFMEICRARFEDPLGFGEQITWSELQDTGLATADADVSDERQMTVYVTADGEEIDYDPNEVLPFDPLAASPFESDDDSKTRQAFEEMLAADDGLHTVRYIKELNHELRNGETLSQVLSATGLAAGDVDRWVRATQEVYDCDRVFPGQEIKLTVDMPDRELKRLQLDSGRDSLIVVEASGDRVVARKQDIVYERSLRVVDARIDRSLYVSAIEERIPDRIISEMAEILGWDINFGRDLQEGSTFRVIYEQLTRVDTADTIPGRVLAVEVSNRGQLYEGFYFERGDAGEGAYYDRDGESLGRSFLRFPVSYSRVSSPFSTARYHPVLKRRIPHYGVDFAAPTGTPVRAVADGKVLKSGWYGGNGRFVKIRHDSVYESGYAHLSRIASNVVANSTVKKGQVIGYVGSTGLATGPHLHFAMYQSGKYIDPMRTELPRARSLEGRELTGFKMKVAMMDRAYAESGEGEERSTQVASAAVITDLPTP